MISITKKSVTVQDSEGGSFSSFHLSLPYLITEDAHAVLDRMAAPYRAPIYLHGPQATY